MPESQEGTELGGRGFLDPSKVNPISADPSVWLRSEDVGERWTGLLPDFLNPLYLSSDLNRLCEAYASEGLATSDLLSLCVTVDPNILFSLSQRFGPELFLKRYREDELICSNWRLRGFDVVDLDGLISGLKGCGYREPFWSRLRSSFGDKLNDDGLFFDVLNAYQFAEARGLEIRQHAPFVVVGLLTLQQASE